MSPQLDLWAPSETTPAEAIASHGLRPYQEEAVRSIQRELANNRSTLVVMPTGSGKTRVMTEVAQRRKDDKILVLAHRDELLQQAVERFGRDCDEKIGLDKAAAEVKEKMEACPTCGQPMKAKEKEKEPANA